MKTSITHLPDNKQQEIKAILEIIKEEANPVKVILFGSHASDNWVEHEYTENGTTYSYISDYDLLVVLMDTDKGKEVDIASKIENRTLKYKNDVAPIVHTIDYINEGLKRGQYFFKDIVRHGIILFDNGDFFFSESKPLTKEQIRAMALQDFDGWVKSGSRFLAGAKIFLEKALQDGFIFNEVVFMLNQSAEKFYAGVLLVHTGYKPKTHRLRAYRKYSKHISEELNQVFKYPTDDSEEKRLFDILNRSYIDARYKYDYFIDLDDLKKLILKVEKLEKVVIYLCNERLRYL